MAQPATEGNGKSDARSLAGRSSPAARERLARLLPLIRVDQSVPRSFLPRSHRDGVALYSERLVTFHVRHWRYGVESAVRPVLLVIGSVLAGYLVFVSLSAR